MRVDKVIAQACRYGGEASGQADRRRWRKRTASRPNHIMLAAGSGEILRAVTLAFTGPGKALVLASPTFEAPGRTAQMTKAEVRAVPVTATGLHDLKAMAGVSSGAGHGLHLQSQQSRPAASTRTPRSREFVKAFRAASPDGYVLMDEAYYDYATDPSYATAIPMIAKDPKVLVSRTFSKIHGMAGMRVGYLVGHPDALAIVRAKTSSGTLSAISAAAALASFEDQAYLANQKKLNTEARAFTRKAFVDAGYNVLPSEGNFVMVDVKREAAVYQQMCREAGVAIARPFPPLTNYARITIGTMDEMRKALPLMIPLLSAPSQDLGSGGARARRRRIRRPGPRHLFLLIGAIRDLDATRLSRTNWTNWRRRCRASHDAGDGPGRSSGSGVVAADRTRARRARASSSSAPEWPG